MICNQRGRTQKVAVTQQQPVSYSPINSVMLGRVFLAYIYICLTSIYIYVYITPQTKLILIQKKLCLMKKKWIIMLILFLSIGVVTLFMTQTIKFGGEQKGLAQKIQEVTNLEHRNSSYQMVFNAEPEICRDSSTYRCLGIASQREIENATFTLHWFYSDGTKIVKELINTEKDVIKKPVFISGNVYPDVFDDKNLHYHLFLMKCINDDVDADLNSKHLVLHCNLSQDLAHAMADQSMCE